MKQNKLGNPKDPKRLRLIEESYPENLKYLIEPIKGRFREFLMASNIDVLYICKDYWMKDWRPCVRLSLYAERPYLDKLILEKPVYSATGFLGFLYSELDNFPSWKFRDFVLYKIKKSFFTKKS